MTLQGVYSRLESYCFNLLTVDPSPQHDANLSASSYDWKILVLNRPDVKEKFFNAGSKVVASSPDALASARKADMLKIRKLIKDVGIRE